LNRYGKNEITPELYVYTSHIQSHPHTVVLCQ